MHLSNPITFFSWMTFHHDETILEQFPTSIQMLNFAKHCLKNIRVNPKTLKQTKATGDGHKQGKSSFPPLEVMLFTYTNTYTYITDDHTSDKLSFHSLSRSLI